MDPLASPSGLLSAALLDTPSRSGSTSNDDFTMGTNGGSTSDRTPVRPSYAFLSFGKVMISHMTVTQTQLERPAWFKGWGLGVNNLARPSRVFAYKGANVRNPGDPIATADYEKVCGDLVGWLVTIVGTPERIAHALDTQLSMKFTGASLRSP